MNVLVFPLIAVYHWGKCFDLAGYTEVSVNPYDDVDLRNYIENTNINTFTSKFKVYETTYDIAKFLGMDPVSYMKMRFDLWYYGPSTSLLYSSERDRYKKIMVAVKMSLRTVRKSVLTSAPTNEDWETRQATKGGSHYFKSVVDGAEIHAVIEIENRNESVMEIMRREIGRDIGFEGTFDENFLEKLLYIARDEDTGFSLTGVYTRGLELDFYHSMSKLLQIKSDLEGNRSLLVDSIGIMYEFNSLSEISSLPPVKINPANLIKAERLAFIYDDVIAAEKEFNNLLRNNRYDYTDEDFRDYRRALKIELRDMKREIARLVRSMDITTEGDRSQFDQVFLMYNSTDTKKYRKSVRYMENRYF